ncbi:MAG: hypothetical protein SwBeaMacB_16180 [Shewanella algae]|nr:hypothetical protein TUM4442_32550 [Shewanella algae]BCV59366.1 hypothetical protein TUM17384_33110 [Shewanella algae]
MAASIASAIKGNPSEVGIKEPGSKYGENKSVTEFIPYRQAIDAALLTCKFNDLLLVSLSPGAYA